ncbi:MAG: hypothetical protein E7411_07515 [Ruminococcaceae bacterium]|nr:hypothetical protein [Oscillospiraceae bacterium]
MKKNILLLFVAILALFLCACSTSLTEAKEKCCVEADKLFNSMADELNLSFERKMDKIDGKNLYVATLDFDGKLTDSNATTFQQYVMPVAEKILGEEDIYVVLYLNENGDEVYRLLDSKLDPDVFD